MPPPAPAQSTVTSLPLAALKVAVNVRLVEPLSPSVTLGESIDSDGVASSSVKVIVAGLTVRLPKAPLTVTVSFASSSASAVGVRVKVPVPLVAPAAIVMSKSDTAAKSTAPAAPLPATLTVTVLSVGNRVVPAQPAWRSP